MLREIFSQIKELIGIEIMEMLNTTANHIKNISIKLAISLISLYFSIFGIYALLIGLFFYFSKLSQLVLPAIYTGLISILLGLIVFTIGLKLSNKIK